MRKNVSLQHTNEFDGHRNDYRNWENRRYIRDEARCDWVKLWVHWDKVQPNPAPSDLYANWAAIGAWPHWWRLDAQIAQANADGRRVSLQIDCRSPTWATGTSSFEKDTNKDPRFHVIADPQVGGPWERFFSFCYNRYRPGAGQNPAGAYIDAIEPINEPNQLMWPQENLHCSISTMMQTVENVVAFWGPHAMVLMPNVADMPNKTTGSVRDWTDYLTFTNGVLDLLRNWRPRMYVGWSLHNYRDIRYGPEAHGTTAKYRARWVMDSLSAYNWKGSTTDRAVWISEGGYELRSDTAAEKQAQADRIGIVWNDMRATGQVAMGSQHGIFDEGNVPNAFRTGFRQWTPADQGVSGVRYPAWERFRTLPN
jgi:hypothetical protein